MTRDDYVITAVVRTLKVLECFTVQTPELALMEIATRLGERKGTVYRFVSTLVHIGYLEIDPADKRYRLGPRALSLSHVAMATVDMRKRALPYLRHLFEQVHENVNLSILDQGDILFVERFQSSFFLNMNIAVGTRLPIHVSSMGKVMVAHLSLEEQEHLLERLKLHSFTDRTIVDHEKLRAELQRIRKHGYALNDEELEKGLIAIAAPIWGWDGTVKAAINVTGPTARLGRDHLETVIRPMLLKTAREISAALGAPNLHEMIEHE